MSLVLAALDGLHVPNPWNLDDFVSAFEAQWCRTIRVVPYPKGSPLHRPCGLLVRYDDSDLIVYEPSTSEYHCQQIILHEIGHIVLRHKTSYAGGPAVESVAHHLLPDVDIDAITLVLGRNIFDSDQEHQAELFASLLLSRQCTRR